MKTLFLVLVGIFQLLGCLQPVQEVVQMVMSTGLVKDPQIVFTCLALSIVVFAALVRFVPGFAGPFQRFEDRLKGLFTGAGQSAGPATELASQVQSLAADVQLLKSLIVPAQGVTQNPANLDALATGQPTTGVPQ